MKSLGVPFLMIAALSSAQTTGKTLRFVHTSGEQNQNELATAVRAIAEVPQLLVDTAANTMELHGGPGNVAAGEWVFHELDRPLSDPPPASPRSYKMEDSRGEGLIRIFRLSHVPAPNQLQEIATAVRAITEVRRLFTYNAPRVILIRGTEEQIAAAEWVLQQLDVPAARRGQFLVRERAIPDSRGEGQMRIYFTANTASVQSLQELATCTRALVEIRRLFTYSPIGAILLRGTEGQMQLAQWLLRELDKPAARPAGANVASQVYQMAEDPKEGTVKIFFLTQTETVNELQQTAVTVRTTTAVRRLFTYNAPRAIAIRGSANQIARASDLLNLEEK